jgi:hypothetical protein
MTHARESGSERRLREEIGRIDRSILLLVDARDRAVRRLRSARPRGASEGYGDERAAITAARAWAAETGLPDRLARRVAAWLAHESEGAFAEPRPGREVPSITYEVEPPPASEGPLTVSFPRRALITPRIR